MHCGDVVPLNGRHLESGRGFLYHWNFMLKRYMHKRERHLAMLNDNRLVRPFEWGTEFIGEDRDADDPHRLFAEFSRKAIENSEEYFAVPSQHDFTLTPRSHRSAADGIASTSNGRPPADAGRILTWTSAVTTPSRENNTAYATYFPHEDHRAAVIVLPHWNAKAGTYFDLCGFFNKVGLSSLRLTLPYHEERMPPELER